MPAAAPAPHPDDAAAALASTEAKAALRTRLRAARRGLGPAGRARQAEAAAEHLWTWLGPHLEERTADGPPVVATVLPMPTEPDTGPVRERALAAGARVLVPVIEPGRHLSWTAWRPGVAVARAANAPLDEPVGPREPGSVLDGAALVLMPGLAVDRTGARLGQGGGYYDRFLATLPSSVPTVAFVHPSEVLEPGVIPLEPTDRPVDGVLTADGLLWCEPASAGPQ